MEPGIARRINLPYYMIKGNICRGQAPQHRFSRLRQILGKRDAGQRPCTDREGVDEIPDDAFQFLTPPSGRLHYPRSDHSARYNGTKSTRQCGQKRHIQCGALCATQAAQLFQQSRRDLKAFH